MVDLKKVSVEHSIKFQKYKCTISHRNSRKWMKLKEGIQLITRPHIPAPVVAHVTLLPCMHVVQHKPDKLLFSTSPSHNYEDAY